MEIRIKIIERKKKWRDMRGIFNKHKEVKMLIKDGDKKMLFRYMLDKNDNSIISIGTIPEGEYDLDIYDEWVILRKIEKKIEIDEEG